MFNSYFKRAVCLAGALAFFGATPGFAADSDYAGIPEAQDFATGMPAVPTDTWLLSAGGRIYDTWWNALDKDPPDGTHPAYPTAGQKSGSTTWRCKECHGWDYQGADGVYGAGSHFTGIMGINGAIGRDEGEIAAMMRDPLHGYTEDMISDLEMARLAGFVSRGQVDMSKYVNLLGRTVIQGDLGRGRAIFQNTCAACHGFDGRLLDWGDGDEHAFVGTEAQAAPDEVFGKIMNGHPGEAMLNLRAFGAPTVHDVLTYVTTLPAE